MNNLIYILMAPQEGQQGNPYSTLIMLALLILVFWLFFIRPQIKKTKEQNKFRESLKKGQRIITIGGIHGKIVEVGDTYVIIETESQCKLKMEKTAIAAEFNPEEIANKK